MADGAACKSGKAVLSTRGGLRLAEPRYACEPNASRVARLAASIDARNRHVDQPPVNPGERALALDRARRALRRDADDRARRDDRERRAPVDPGRPGLLAVEPRLGGQRLPDRVRRPAAARRPARRPDRPQARLHGRAHGLRPRLAAVRSRAEPGGADRGPLPPGRGRRADLGRDPRHDRDDVPRAARAGEGDRDLQLRRLGRRVDRPARRRRAHRGHQLALDLLRQPADRRRDRAVRRASARRRPGHRAARAAPTCPAPC